VSLPGPKREQRVVQPRNRSYGATAAPHFYSVPVYLSSGDGDCHPIWRCSCRVQAAAGPGRCQCVRVNGCGRAITPLAPAPLAPQRPVTKAGCYHVVWRMWGWGERSIYALR
jgi:hypothetical protein